VSERGETGARASGGREPRAEDLFDRAAFERRLVEARARRERALGARPVAQRRPQSFVFAAGVGLGLGLAILAVTVPRVDLGMLFADEGNRPDVWLSPGAPPPTGVERPRLATFDTARPRVAALSGPEVLPLRAARSPSGNLAPPDALATLRPMARPPDFVASPSPTTVSARQTPRRSAPPPSNSVEALVGSVARALSAGIEAVASGSRQRTIAQPNRAENWAPSSNVRQRSARPTAGSDDGPSSSAASRSRSVSRGDGPGRGSRASAASDRRSDARGSRGSNRSRGSDDDDDDNDDDDDD